MDLIQPVLRQPVPVHRPQTRVPATRGFKTAEGQTGLRGPKSWRRERRRGTIALITVVFVFGVLLSGYAVQAQMSQAAARAAARDMRIALATGAALQAGMVLFVPQYGNICRRRWIDNQTWTLRDGGEVACDSEVRWNANLPVREYKIERRLDAIRNVFQSRNIGG